MTDRARLVAEHGRVVDTTTKRSLGYGELTAGRKLTETIRDDVAPKPATAWTVAGTSLSKVDARGSATDTIDSRSLIVGSPSPK